MAQILVFNYLAGGISFKKTNILLPPLYVQGVIPKHILTT